LVDRPVWALAQLTYIANAHHVIYFAFADAAKFIILRQPLNLIETAVGGLIESTESFMACYSGLLQNRGCGLERGCYRRPIGPGDKRGYPLSEWQRPADDALYSSPEATPEAADGVAQTVHALHILIEGTVRSLADLAEIANAHHASCVVFA
jgi:hypothetical protein